MIFVNRIYFDLIIYGMNYMFKVVIKRVVFVKMVNVFIKVCKCISNFIWFCVVFFGCIIDFRIKLRRFWMFLFNEFLKKL